jgi:uncharacterized protein with von Willebrand factor type A (vWA) domain
VERIVARLVVRLRRRGLRVSPGESADAVRALGATGLQGRERVKAALQLTLAKTQKDQAVFAEVFEQFFRGGPASAPRNGAEVADSAVVDLEPGRAVRAAQHEGGEKSGVTLLTADEAMDDLDLDGLEALDSDAGGGAGLTVETGRYRGEQRKASAPSNYTRGPIYLRMDDDFLAKWRNDGLSPFTPEEEQAMAEVVDRMVKRLKKDARRMRSKQSRGRLHVVKTLQKNYRHGMVPFDLVLRRRRRELPRLVVLCDVSFSVSHASRFLLLLLHTLQKGLLDVRSFVFNREIAEVTPLLATAPVNTVLELIHSGAIVDLQANSDFGNVFESFQRDFLDSLRGRPAVIVLGDARNNYNEAREAAFAEIRDRAGYLMWLTPEDRSSWDLGDCLLGVYGPVCDRVEVVKNVEELGAVVEQLVRNYFAGDLRPQTPGQVVRAPWQHGGLSVRS